MKTSLGLFFDQLLAFFYHLPLLWYVNAGFALFIITVLCGGYRLLRWAAGHTKFKGKWYSPDQFQALKEEIYFGYRNGRLPDSETMAMLDKHIYGKEQELRRINGNDWL